MTDNEKAELERLRAENAALKAGGPRAITFKVSEKGGLSMYGMGRFPVTLYTSTNCAPCGAGRTLLASRGIPFSERTVATNDSTMKSPQCVAAAGSFTIFPNAAPTAETRVNFTVSN